MFFESWSSNKALSFVKTWKFGNFLGRLVAFTSLLFLPLKDLVDSLIKSDGASTFFFYCSPNDFAIHILLAKILCLFITVYIALPGITSLKELQISSSKVTDYGVTFLKGTWFAHLSP